MLDSEEPTGQGNEEDIAWSAGIQLAIPYTPHTLSLHAANSITSTLQGASRGSGTIRYGFEFTIPLHLRRYFGGGAPAAAEAPPHGAGEEAPAAGKPAEAEAGEEPVPEAGGEPAAAAAVRVSIRDFAFAPARLEVAAGSTVTWTNNDQLAHSATADAGDWESGLIQPGRSSSRKFEKPGTYAYHCTPHPFMKAVVVVR
ncbi:MAG: cupredoxin family copper-binding protein [Gemmatimonadetes bacterium]|nr:cupredoxin family copper-binding protein [Gemmatimonadota bacterium]